LDILALQLQACPISGRSELAVEPIGSIWISLEARFPRRALEENQMRNLSSNELNSVSGGRGGGGAGGDRGQGNSSSNNNNNMNNGGNAGGGPGNSGPGDKNSPDLGGGGVGPR
jgi:hypothetical protein